MTTVLHNVLADMPEKAMPLFEPAPYKVMHGGRGGSKSWSMVRAALILGLKRKLFILCAREFQNSLDESVHKLISDQIEAMNLCEHVDAKTGQTIAAKYIVKETEIVGANGTRFVFGGLRTHVRKIKSMEGIDLCIVFEATFVSRDSWTVLLPTIRRDAPYGPFGKGSEIWVEFNPELASDFTYAYWVANPPEGTVVVQINWRDNEWFPETLRRQKDAMKKNDPDDYRTVWMGKTRRAVKGAIYAKELEKAVLDGRIVPLQLVKSKSVIVSADLGKADMTSLWFWQQVGQNHHAIDHYRNCGFDWAHYLDEIDSRGYRVSLILLPHDAKQGHISAKTSVKAQTIEYMNGDAQRVRIVKRVAHKMHRINHTRQIFPRIYIDEIKCEPGLQSLAHYAYGVNDKGQRTQEPLHNLASHDADGFGTYTTWLVEGEEPDETPPVADIDPYTPLPSRGPQSWMS